MLGNVWEWVSDWYGPYSAAGVQGTPRVQHPEMVTASCEVARGIGMLPSTGPRLVSGACRESTMAVSASGVPGIDDNAAGYGGLSRRESGRAINGRAAAKFQESRLSSGIRTCPLFLDGLSSSLE